MAERIIPIEAISERDIDLLLLEEIHVSKEFRAWLVSKAFSPESVPIAALEFAQHSLTDADGESDICFCFTDSSGEKRALLIENKVAAPPQPGQPIRYGRRGQSGIGEGKWQSFRSCLIAPAQYLSSEQKSAGYGAKISYEDIEAWFRAAGASEPRYQYRADVVRDAIIRARRVGTSRVDPQVTAFWASYWAEVSVLFPELELREPREKGPDSTWILFRPKKLGKDRSIDHKLSRGCVDLSYPSIAADKIPVLQQRWERLLSREGISVEATGKSVALRIQVPVLSPWDEFHDQRDYAREGMKAAFRFWCLANVFDASDA